MARCIIRKCLIKTAQAFLITLLFCVLWIGFVILSQWIADGIAPWVTLLKEALGIILLVVVLPSLLFAMLIDMYRTAKKECE